MLSEKVKYILSRQLKFPQKSIEWLVARRNIISSSEVSSVLESNKYMSSLELLQKKTSNLFTEENNTAISWGIQFEPIAISVYEKINNIKSNPCSLVLHEKYDWLGASPDGILNNGKLLEIKCPFYGSISKIDIPSNYWIQVQMQMECCDLEECEILKNTGKVI